MKGLVCLSLFATQELSLVQVRENGTLNSPLKKLISPKTTAELLQRTGSRPGDLLLIAAGSLHTVVRDYVRWIQIIASLALPPNSAVPSADIAGSSPSTVRRTVGMLWRFSTRSFSLSLSVGGRLPSVSDQWTWARKAGVSPSSVYCSPAGGHTFTVHRTREGSHFSSVLIMLVTYHGSVLSHLGSGPTLWSGAEWLWGGRWIHSNPQGIRAASCPEEHPKGQFAGDKVPPCINQWGQVLQHGSAGGSHTSDAPAGGPGFRSTTSRRHRFGWA